MSVGKKGLLQISRRLLLSLVLALTLLACDKIGPDFRKLEVNLARHWLDGQQRNARKDDMKSWWKVFDDPTLTHLINKAWKNNLDVRMAAVRIMEARAQLGISKSMMFPQSNGLRADGLYEKLSEKSPYYQGYGDYEFPYFQTGFDTAWELDIWGKFRRGIEASGAQMAVRTLDYDDLLVMLTADVAATYIQIRTYQQRLALARSNAELQDRSYRIAESQFRNGLSTELDMQQAKSLKEQTLAEIATLEAGLRQSTNALCQLLGMQPVLLNRELGEDARIPKAVTELAAGVPADMVRQRPDVRLAEFKAAEQSARIGIAKSELLPRLTLTGSVSYATGSFDAIDAMNTLSPSGLAGKIGPTITWPILQFGRLKNNVRVQDARFQETLIGYEKSVLKALREVEDALIAWRKSRERVASLEQGVTASQRAVKLALTQYKNGMEDYTRVLNSEILLVQQQDRLNVSRGDVARNLVGIYKAMGGGWQIREGKEILPTEIKKSMSERTDWGDLLHESPEQLFKKQEKSHQEDDSYFEEAL